MTFTIGIPIPEGALSADQKHLELKPDQARFIGTRLVDRANELDGKKYSITLVCTFCGQQEVTELRVKLSQSYKGVPGCKRCMIKGKDGERVRLCSRYLENNGQMKHLKGAEWSDIHIVRAAKSWQHGTEVWLNGDNRTYDLMDFVPESYQPSDFQRVREKLLTLEAEYKGSIGIFDKVLYTAWTLHGRGLIFASNGDTATLYDFVGADDAPVTDDLAYLDNR